MIKCDCCGVDLKKRIPKQDLKNVLDELKNNNAAFFGDLDYYGSVLIKKQIEKYFSDYDYVVQTDEDERGRTCKNDYHECVFVYPKDLEN